MKQPTTNPNMYDDYTEIDGIRLRVDPINRKRTEDSDNVMAIFYEEQPFTWQFIQPYVKKALSESTGKTDFLDVGCGSGVFGLLMAKHYSAKVVCIDKNKRAIEFTRNNAKLNGLEVRLQHQLYDLSSIPEKEAKVMGLYPPYHPYPESIKFKIPQHARGGSDGQGAFRNQLSIADYHLAQNGILFFNQMCVGDKKGPEFLQYIPYFIRGNPSIHYTNVFPPMSTREFLEGVYPEGCEYFIKEMSERSPLTYYAVGIIKRDGKGAIESAEHNIDVKGRSWKDRIEVHHEIAKHAEL